MNWQLGRRFSAYDAACVAREKLGATLITPDRQLTSASGHDATIELI